MLDVFSTLFPSNILLLSFSVFFSPFPPKKRKPEARGQVTEKWDGTNNRGSQGQHERVRKDSSFYHHFFYKFHLQSAQTLGMDHNAIFFFDQKTTTPYENMHILISMTLSSVHIIYETFLGICRHKTWYLFLCMHGFFFWQGYVILTGLIWIKFKDAIYSYVSTIENLLKILFF